MTAFYNRTRAPLVVEVAGGDSFYVPPKTWSQIPPEVIGRSNVAQLVQKGFLFAGLPDEPAPIPVVAPVKPVHAEVVVPTEVVAVPEMPVVAASAPETLPDADVLDAKKADEPKLSLPERSSTESLPRRKKR